jgi:DNA-binding CsgD family transcriptional regulator
VGLARMGRPGLSEARKKELWEKWKAGESISDIARALKKPPGSIHGVLKATGGISPPRRRRSRWALTLAEREEISRGLAAGESLHAIAARLGRSASTVSREVGRITAGVETTGPRGPTNAPGKESPAPEKMPARQKRAPVRVGGKEAEGRLVAAADLRLAGKAVS